MDLSRVTVFCFTASYAVALSLEAVSVVRQRRFGLHRTALLGFAAAGVFAHVAYLITRAAASAAPLSSPADWCLLAALVLAVVYLVSTFSSPRLATGLFLLPVLLGLIAFSGVASPHPLAPERASLFWGQTHSWLLILATVSVSLGFLAGLMYLIQSWRLKKKLPPSRGFRLPSLEALERINSRSLALSVWFVAGGFVSGLVLVQIRRHGEPERPLLSDPVVISLACMLGWLVVAEVFRLVYPAARTGRKVAYLTLASFLFLVITLTSVVLVRGVHRPAAAQPTTAGDSGRAGDTARAAPPNARGGPVPKSTVSPTPRPAAAAPRPPLASRRPA